MDGRGEERRCYFYYTEKCLRKLKIYPKLRALICIDFFARRFRYNCHRVFGTDLLIAH